MMNDIDDLLDSAFDDYNHGDLVQAEQKARDALIVSPSHGDCFYLLGLIAHKKGIFTQACDLLNIAVKAYPEQKNYRLALAEVYQHHGDYEKALELYQPFADIPDVRVQIGWIALGQKKRERSRKIFKSLLSTTSAYKGYHGLAFCHRMSKRLFYLKKSFKIKNDPLVAEDIVKYYLSVCCPQKTRPYLLFVQNEILKSKCLIELKKYQDALPVLNEYIQKNRYDIDAFVLAGICAENLKNYQLSENFYRQAISLDPDNFDAHRGMARLMMRQKKLPQALDHYQILCRINPKDKETLLAMATTLEGVGDDAEALGIYFRLLTLKSRGLDLKIKGCIERLVKKDAKLGKQFAQGWVKNYPKNQIAQKLLKTLGVFLMGLSFIVLPVKADYFSDEQNWDLVWKNRMAELGHPESQYELAQIFESGEGVPANISQAIRYYQLAAAQDYFPAMLKLGNIFNQKNAYHDTEKSLQWYTYAAQKGEVQAQLYLADYFQENDHYDKNQAKYWLEKALVQIFPDAADLTQISPDYKELMKD